MLALYLSLVLIRVTAAMSIARDAEPFSEVSCHHSEVLTGEMPSISISAVIC